jgi:hypothetical protein
MLNRSVVLVPRDRSASPGAERATTVAELSPVNGAIMQSTDTTDEKYCQPIKNENQTWIESPTLNPPLGDASENGAAADRLRADFSP